MHHQAGVLQQRVQLGSVERDRAQPRERIGGEQTEADEGRAQHPLHRQHPRLQRLTQRAAEVSDRPAVQGKDQHPQQHGAFMAAPGRGEPVGQRLGAVTVFGDQFDGEVHRQIGRGEGSEGQSHEEHLQQGGGASEGHQNGIATVGAQQGSQPLDQSEHEGEDQSQLADFRAHSICSATRPVL